MATARAIAALGRAYLTARRTAEAVALLEPAVVEFADLGDDPALAGLHSQLARACMFIGDNRRAVEMADRALEVAEHADLVALLADTLITKGSALGDLGRIQEGIGAIETGERLARSAGLVATLLRGINNRTVYQGEIDPAAVLEASTEGLALSRRMGQRHWTFGFSVGIGYACYRLGEWDRAVAVLAEALADDPAPEDRIMLLSNAALVPAFRGDDVEDVLAEIAALIGTSTDLSPRRQHAGSPRGRGSGGGAARRRDGRVPEGRRARARASMGRISRMFAAHAALWGGDIAEASVELEAIVASGFRAPTVEARRSTISAGLAAAEGRQADALALYRDAMRRWRDLGLVFDEALAGIDMVTLLDTDVPEVRAVADSTRAILERLGARPLIARLETALSRPSSLAPHESARSRDPSKV